MFVHIFTSITRSGLAPLVSRTVATYSTQFKSHAFKFFASYANFTLNRDAPPTREFRRLKLLKDWKDDDKEYAEARERFADALAEDFNVKYGADVNNIDYWHALCHVCGVDPVPKDISACREAVKSSHVNLVDLVYHMDKVRPFPSLEALARYSKRRNKLYPKKPAKAGGILRYLLRHTHEGVETPLEWFFSLYPEFQYQPSNCPVAEFNRLCEESKWKKGDPAKDAAWDMFNVAIKEELDELYGSDENDIKNWQELCRVLKVDPVPETPQGCRAVVLKKHVNLVDFVCEDKKDIHIFRTERELSEYTLETGKIFPNEDAVDHWVLRALRRHILSPRDDGENQQSET